MATNASTTALPSESAKKRKGAPTTNEIFTNPVLSPDESKGDDSKAQVPKKKIHVAQSSQVVIPAYLTCSFCRASMLLN
jgi:hypothetical protein